MNINISQKLGLSAALVVGIVGCFSESAEAGRFILTGQSNQKQGSKNSVEAKFILDTDNGVIEDFKVIDLITGNLLNDSLPVEGETVKPSNFTDEERGFVNELLDKVKQSELDLDNDLIQYELTGFQGLPNYEVQLYIPYRTEDEKNSLASNLAAFDKAFADNPQIQDQGIPGIIIRDFIADIDGSQENSVDGKALDLFNVNSSGSTFTVKEIKKQSTPEPTTAVGLLAALAVGGLSLRKGDRRVKSKAIIKN